MRVATDTQLLEVDPGEVASVRVEIVNTGQVIDGLTARIIGLPQESVRAEPALLPLFPDATGEVMLSLTVPASHPAGRHPLTVEVISHGARLPSAFVDVDLQVAAHPAMSVAPKPRMIRSRRQGRFVLEIANEGNLPLEVSLQAMDTDRAVTTVFTPSTVRVAAGSIAPVLLTVKGPRMLLGAEIDRAVSVQVTARANEAAGPAGDEEPLVLRQETGVRLRQRPQLSRGLLTALVLASIIGLWAGAFLLGLNKVFAGDPATKAAPASFFAASQTAAGSGAGGTAAGAAAGGAAPAGALPKSGQVPTGIGSTISGTVSASSDHKGVGRILVEALRQTPKGLIVVSSAATQSDGTYTVAGLFPTQYLLRFTSAGFKTVWYPSASSQAAAQTVGTSSQGATNGVNAVITGNPASMSGTVDPGDTLTPVTTTVAVRSLVGSAATPIATTKTAADGSYRLGALPAPGSYELTFTAAGYEPTTLVDTVTGGQQRLEPTVRLAVGNGQISGLVSSSGTGLGGVTVSTTVGGAALSITTPTTGAVGTFVLGGLPTPATYVITFAREGFGAQTTVIDLTAGQSRTNLAISLASGTGSVSGCVTTGTDCNPGNGGLGGATITVGGAVNNGGSSGGSSGGAGPAASAGSGTAASGSGTGSGPSTTTLTQGATGTFALNGLAAPGSYTLTVSLPGYQSASVPVTLTGTGAPPSIRVTLTTQLGSILGRVRDSSGARAGATVTATDGKQNWTTTSTGNDGSYVLDGLMPGTYSVTVTATGSTQQTALVTVTAGRTSAQNLTLGGS
ncbi:MAG: hypothetical protein QOD87_629 [Pseudonocardiales bacterium]|nr:hypothetical protein [Pseudonocardiales bacterium]